MVLDMGPMLRGEVTSIPFDFPFSPTPPAGVTFGEGARARGVITDSAGYMRMKAQLEVPYTGECARCLAPVSDTFSLPMEWTVVTEGTLTEEQLYEGEEEYAVIEDGKLDVDQLLEETVLLTFPTRLLCAEDCPGLCPKCGKPLKEGPCGCNTREIDPRLAILATFFEQDGEEKSGKK